MAGRRSLRALRRLGEPRVIRIVNGYFTLLWLLLAVPTLLWWQTSVLWVALLSLWANIISHYTAWLAARVEVRAAVIEAHQQRIAQDTFQQSRHTEEIVERVEAHLLALKLRLADMDMSK